MKTLLCLATLPNDRICCSDQGKQLSSPLLHLKCVKYRDDMATKLSPVSIMALCQKPSRLGNKSEKDEQKVRILNRHM